MSHLEIAHQIGTPTYVYDRACIESNYAQLAKAFPGAQLCYAVKANNNHYILKLLHELGAGFDVVSVGEMLQALRAGADPAHIVFAGVGKRDDEMIAALDRNIGWINVESAQELRVLSDLATVRGQVQRVALRINPGVDPHTHHYLATGKANSKFGIEVNEALQLVAQQADFAGVHIAGIHFHIGSMISEIEPYTAAVKIAIDLIEECRALGAAIDTLDIGGGYGIVYTPDQTRAPVAEIGAGVVALAKTHGLQLHLEPGRWIVGDAAVLLTRVLFTKQNGGINYAVVDAAMNDLIRPALYQAKHPVTLVPNDSGTKADANASLISYNIVGPVCESGDILAQSEKLPLLHRGDLLAIHCVGAYGMSMASNYNTRPRGAEVMIESNRDQGWCVIRERERLEGLVNL